MLTYAESLALVAGCLTINAAVMALTVRALRRARRDTREANKELLR